MAKKDQIAGAFNTIIGDQRVKTKKGKVNPVGVALDHEELARLAAHGAVLGPEVTVYLALLYQPLPPGHGYLNSPLIYFARARRQERLIFQPTTSLPI